MTMMVTTDLLGTRPLDHKTPCLNNFIILKIYLTNEFRNIFTIQGKGQKIDQGKANFVTLFHMGIYYQWELATDDV